MPAGRHTDRQTDYSITSLERQSKRLSSCLQSQLRCLHSQTLNLPLKISHQIHYKQQYYIYIYIQSISFDTQLEMIKLIQTQATMLCMTAWHGSIQNVARQNFPQDRGTQQLTWWSEHPMYQGCSGLGLIQSQSHFLCCSSPFIFVHDNKLHNTDNQTLVECN